MTLQAIARGQRNFTGIIDDDDAFDPDQHKGEVTVTTMHSINHSLESFRHVFEPLSQFAHVYTVDLRGHGQSGWVDNQYECNYSCSVCCRKLLFLFK